MAEEMRGQKADELVTDTIQEIQKTKRKHKMTAVFPSELVEGMMTHCLVQLKHQMNSLFLIFHDKESAHLYKTQGDKLDAIKGVHIIFLQEIDTITHCLKPYSNAALNKKHRAMRAIAVTAKQRLLDLAPKLREAKYINNQYVTQFAKEICLICTNFYVCLHEKTPSKERSRIVKEYCDED